MPPSIDPPRHPSAPTLHRDPLAARFVFLAPQRAERPSDLGGDAGGSCGPRLDGCPFCAGHEHRTPPAVLRAPADEATPWRSRIVPNRYPVVHEGPPLRGDPSPQDHDDGSVDPSEAMRRPARGVHDVVVEAARHLTTILAIEPAAWREVWHLCRQRLACLADRGDVAWATVFKNSGSAAGASLEHVHSQLVGLDFVPPVVRAELAAAADDAAGYRRLVDDARTSGRVVAEAGRLVAIVPPAPRQPLETCILPTVPAAHFHAAEPADVAALADLTRLVVARLDGVAPGANYNWWLHQAPFAGHGEPVPGWHWHLEILPRLASFAGFEFATGCHISTLPPAEAAAMLRGG
jgi:UDPglucose--hexose-1-phosphate uridylyltransferase